MHHLHLLFEQRMSCMKSKHIVICQRINTDVCLYRTKLESFNKRWWIRRRCKCGWTPLNVNVTKRRRVCANSGCGCPLIACCKHVCSRCLIADTRESQEELETSRQYIIMLMEASAKIGHFSMRTGGGYENVGKAWEGLHRYIASTKWGREAGLHRFLDQHGFGQSQTAVVPGPVGTLFEEALGSTHNSGDARGMKVPRFKVAVGPVFNEGPHSARPKSARKGGLTPRTPRTQSARMREMSPTTPRALSARDIDDQYRRPLSARDRKYITLPERDNGQLLSMRLGTMARTVEISTPRAKTPRVQDPSPPRSPPRTTPRATATPREQRFRESAEAWGGWGEAKGGSVSARLQECAVSLRFDSRRPVPQESKEAARGRREFWGVAERGVRNRSTTETSASTSERSRSNWSGFGTGSIMRSSAKRGGERDYSSSPESGKLLSSSPLRRGAKARWLDQDEQHEGGKERTQDLVKLATEVWEEFDADGPDHASAVSRSALPLLIKRLSPGISDGVALRCSEAILTQFCHADPQRVYKNEVLFALLKPHILHMMVPGGAPTNSATTG